jgi:hypothetical protein
MRAGDPLPQLSTKEEKKRFRATLSIIAHVGPTCWTCALRLPYGSEPLTGWDVGESPGRTHVVRLTLVAIIVKCDGEPYINDIEEEV